MKVCPLPAFTPRIASSLAADETLKLLNAINKESSKIVLHMVVRLPRLSWWGKSVSHQHHLTVYGRKSAPCFLCGESHCLENSCWSLIFICAECQK